MLTYCATPIIVTALSLMLALPAHDARAQSYPQRPVKVVVVNPAGQGTDIITRMYTAKLAAMGQNFFVENRPGAGGTVGAREVAKAAPDGYTLLVGTAATHGISLALYDNPGYHPEDDFVPIGMLGLVPMAIAARSDLGMKTFADLVAKSKQAPMNTAIPSPMAQLVRDQIVKRNNAGLASVPYKGSAAAVNDMLGGHVDVLVDTAPAIQPHVASGRFAPIAITTSEQSRLMPGVKTVAEQGLPGFEVPGWFMLFAPKGTSPEVVRAINAEMQKIPADPEFQNQLLSRGFDVTPVGDPARLRQFVHDEHARWVRAAKESNMRAE